MSAMPTSTPTPSKSPASFIIYHEGNALQLKTDAVSEAHCTAVPAIRLCAIDEQQLLLLNCEHQLLHGQLDATNRTLHLKLLRDDIIDVDYCRGTRTVFIVRHGGGVFAQTLNNFKLELENWTQITFDPLELSEDGIRIARVKCSMHGALFVTNTNNELYALGNCGEIFQAAELEPQHLRLFEEPKEILDLVAGDEHFALLLRHQEQDLVDEILFRSAAAHKTTGTSALAVNNRVNALQVRTSPQKDFADDTSSSIKTHKRNSSSSGNSICSQASNSQHSEHSEETLQLLLRQGCALLKTQVYTFGANNNGLLGTGDHIKRPNTINIQKLNDVGVCSIAAGREHTIARTLDGRLFHWGLNTKQQLNGKRDCLDMSTPTELKLDLAEMSPLERGVLAICGGDFQTVLLNAKGELFSKDLQFKNDLLTSSCIGNAGKNIAPPLLATNNFTLHNQCHTALQEFYQQLSNLRLQLQNLLQQRIFVQNLRTFQHANICPLFYKMLYLLAVSLKSLECFYRGDLETAADLTFIRYYKSSIALFEEYTKAFCDVRSVNGFADAAKQVFSFINFGAQQNADMDVERIFKQPFQIYPNFVQVLESLCKRRIEFTEHLLAWQSFASQHRIDLEVADHTQDFWQRYERCTKLQRFRRKQRRVIFSSDKVNLRLANVAISNIVPGAQPVFILFSDCLCQYGTQLQTYPLVAMWLKSENEKQFRITTPEKSFSLVARSHHDKELWYTELEKAIMIALGRAGAKMSSTRAMAYVYSSKHPKYASVDAYGQWRNGVLHGSCYLQFPDEKFYVGEIRNGEIEGYGKMVTPSVGFYEGTFKGGKFHGYGSYEMKDNELYTGNFRDGFFHGHGMLRTSTYNYVGEFQANSKSGYGILDDAITGDKYMGMFADNKRTGAGTCITMNGDYFEGIFVNDELAGQGIAVFENDYVYEGELTLHGPMGKGTYYMPHGTVECENISMSDDDEASKRKLIGNVLSGHLAGSWNDVRVVSGTVAINRQFPKIPKSIGDLIVDNSRKWRTLFDNFEEEVLGVTFITEPPHGVSSSNTRELWNRIAVYMTTLRDREKTREQQDSAYQSYVHSYFAKNISMGFSAGMEKLSIKSSNSLMTSAKSSILDLSDDALRLTRRSHSQETLEDLNDLDFMNSTTFPNNEENSFQNLLNTQLGNWANDSSSSLRSSFDSVLNLSNNSKNFSFSSQMGLEIVPSFGMTTLTAEDVASIKEYLVQAFKDPHHPLHMLNQRVANSFYTSYGCWKVKPTPILAKQAMREWESISKRVYRFVRKMFPALPEDFCVIESTREVVSHITLLYPIVLSEGIYSTLFVLYANKYSGKDEMYRQNLMFAEKLNDKELSDCLGLDSILLPVVSNEFFNNAIQTLKQLQEKYSPKAMLTVIEKCMQLITEAHKLAECENSILLAADSMMPLTLFLVLRASVPHLGAELALLDDLTGGSNFQIEMNGFAGYCYTTLKASYEHITAAPLKKT